MRSLWVGMETLVLPENGEVDGGTVMILGPLPAWIGSDAGILFYWDWPRWAYLVSIDNVALTRGQLRMRAMDMLNELPLDTHLLLEYDTATSRSKVTIAPKGDIDSDGIPALQMFTSPSTTAVPNTIEIGTEDSDPTGTDVKLYGVSLPRGFQRLDADVADTAAIVPATETIIQTITDMVWRTGRAYRVKIGGRVSSVGVPAVARYQLRRTNLAGAVVGVLGQVEINQATINAVNIDIVLRRTAATDLTQTLVCTIMGTGANIQQRGAGTVPRFMEITDIGSADDYVDMPTI